jgi:hypothetical protein
VVFQALERAGGVAPEHEIASERAGGVRPARLDLHRLGHGVPLVGEAAVDQVVDPLSRFVHMRRSADAKAYLMKSLL